MNPNKWRKQLSDGLSAEKTQREAAEAVRQVGLNQIREIDEEIFKEAPEWKEMFFQWLEELKKYER